MNKKGSFLYDQGIYLLLLVIFVAFLFLYIGQQREGAAVWEDYYAKELSKIINLAKPGDEVVLDVQKVTDIAAKNKVKLENIFGFSNNQVCVKLDLGRQSCYYYFSNLSVVKNDDGWIVIGGENNLLKFKVVEAENE